MSANVVGKGFLQLCVTPRLMLLHHTLDNIIITVNVCVSEIQLEEGNRGGKCLSLFVARSSIFPLRECEPLSREQFHNSPGDCYETEGR